MEGDSIVLWVLIGTCFLQWVTVVVLIRRVRETEKPLAWNLLGMAVSVLAIQQSYGLYVQWVEINPPLLNILKELLGLLVSGLMLGGIVALASILKIIERNKEVRAVPEWKVIQSCCGS